MTGRVRFIVLACATLLACGAGANRADAPAGPSPTAEPAVPYTPPPPRITPGRDDVSMGQGVVDNIDGIRLGLANVFPGSYTLPGWKPRPGYGAQVWVEKRDDAIVEAEGLRTLVDSYAFEVGEGSTFRLGPSRWKVVSVMKAGIRLQRLP